MEVAWLGKGYKKSKIVKKKPANTVMIGKTKHFTRYVRGVEEFIVPKRGVRVRKTGMGAFIEELFGIFD